MFPEVTMNYQFHSPCVSQSCLIQIQKLENITYILNAHMFDSFVYVCVHEIDETLGDILAWIILNC